MYKTLSEENFMLAPTMTQTESSGNASINLFLLKLYSICDIPRVSGEGTIFAYPRVKRLGRRSGRGGPLPSEFRIKFVDIELRKRLHCELPRKGEGNGRSRASGRDMEFDRKFHGLNQFCRYPKLHTRNWGSSLILQENCIRLCI